MLITKRFNAAVVRPRANKGRKNETKQITGGDIVAIHNENIHCSPSQPEIPRTNATIYIDLDIHHFVASCCCSSLYISMHLYVYNVHIMRILLMTNDISRGKIEGNMASIHEDIHSKLPCLLCARYNEHFITNNFQLKLVSHKIVN